MFIIFKTQFDRQKSVRFFLFRCIRSQIYYKFFVKVKYQLNFQVFIHIRKTVSLFIEISTTSTFVVSVLEKLASLTSQSLTVSIRAIDSDPNRLFSWVGKFVVSLSSVLKAAPQKNQTSSTTYIINESRDIHTTHRNSWDVPNDEMTIFGNDTVVLVSSIFIMSAWVLMPLANHNPAIFTVPPPRH